MKESLFLNTLTFSYPKEPVVFYFSVNDDAERKSTRLKSSVLIPKEVKQSTLYEKCFTNKKGLSLYTSFDLPTEGFEPIPIDFNDPENEYLVKRYYNRRLEKYFYYYDDVVITRSGITNDIQVWIKSQERQEPIRYQQTTFSVKKMDRFTLRVKYDRFNRTPYLLVANDRPAFLLGASLERLFAYAPDNPFSGQIGITPGLINKVMTREERTNEQGGKYVVRKIERYAYLQAQNRFCPLNTTRPILGAALKRFFGLDRREEPRTMESKYVKYRAKIEEFRKRFLNPKDIEKIFPELANHFTSVNSMQVGQTDSAKRMLVFGRDASGYIHKNVRPQIGINQGPHIKCPHTDVRLIFIFPESSREEALQLIKMMRDGGYKNQSKSLTHYIGSQVSFADKCFHISFSNEANPVPEIKEALRRDCYRNRDNRSKYVGIYLSPIHKYASEQEAKECYYKIKELFLKLDIPTQCIDRDKMNAVQAKDKSSGRANFIYTLQNMSVAICAKLGGSPWLLDETTQKELIIGIGAFRSDKEQYIGAAFSFDNTGVFNSYCYFQKSELSELVGAIQMAILRYAAVNSRPERIIIHYYKKLSRKWEFRPIEDMLHQLKLDVPVYVVTINKTESEDVVVFAPSFNGLMPYSGTWVNLGPSKEGHRYLLCNNTRYENARFNVMDGFPFPIKLTITCPNRHDEIETPVIQQLIDQVYQFSRIYWKSVKQQGLPVTIKYPEMIAEIMPHFTDKTVYTENNCLWFL